VKKLLSFLRGAAVVAAFAFASMLYVASTPAQAACSKSVVLYSAYWCPYCKQVRSLLGRYHIRYQLIEVTTPRGESLSLRQFGDTSVPRTIIGGVVVEGYEPARIKQLLCLTEPARAREDIKARVIPAEAGIQRKSS
jgi:glutaredoxin